MMDRSRKPKRALTLAEAEQRVDAAPHNANERVLSVPERITAFIATLRATEPKAVFGVTMAEIRDLKAHYSLRYVRVSLTTYRTAVRGALGDTHPALKYLHSFRDDITAYNQVDRAKIYARHHALVPIDPDAFTEFALGQLSSSSYGRAVAALILLTGRRPAEICFTGSFEPIADRDDVVLFAGQAKTKGTPKPPYEIPVLADPHDLIAALAVIRARHVFSSEADAHRKAGEIVAGSREVFGPDYTPKELRKVYAAIVYHDYDRSDPTPRLTEPAYLASVLGHGPGDVTTALSYMAYYVDGDFERTARNFQEGMVGMIPVLEAQRRNADPKVQPFIDEELARVRKIAADCVAPTANPPREPSD